MTSAENSVRDRASKFENFLGEVTRRPPYKARENVPVTKNLATALLSLLSGRQVTFSKAPTSLAAKGFTSVERSLSLHRCIRYVF